MRSNLPISCQLTPRTRGFYSTSAATTCDSAITDYLLVINTEKPPTPRGINRAVVSESHVIYATKSRNLYPNPALVLILFHSFLQYNPLAQFRST